MSFLRRWGFVPLCLIGFAAFIYFGIYLSERERKNNPPPDWSPSGNPLTTMDHHNVLICADRDKDAPPPDNPLQILVHFMGGMGGGQQLKLYPSEHGLCGVLDLTQFGTVPVQVMLSPLGDNPVNFQGFTATYWEPTGKQEPGPAYAWATVALTEREEHWWIQFTFRSRSEPMTSVLVGVE